MSACTPVIMFGSLRRGRTGLAPRHLSVQRCNGVSNVASASGEGSIMRGRERGHHWGGGGFGFGGFGGRGFGGRGEPPPSADDAAAFISGALPDDWFTGPPDITVDRDEIVIIGTLPEPTLADDATDADRAAAEQGRIASFRESTRERRI